MLCTSRFSHTVFYHYLAIQAASAVFCLGKNIHYFIQDLAIKKKKSEFLHIVIISKQKKKNPHIFHNKEVIYLMNSNSVKELGYTVKHDTQNPWALEIWRGAGWKFISWCIQKWLFNASSNSSASLMEGSRWQPSHCIWKQATRESGFYHNREEVVQVWH